MVESLVNGEPIEEKILDTPGHEPQKVLVSASPETRRKAISDLWDRGYGKAEQPISNANDKPFMLQIIRPNGTEQQL